MKKKKEEFCYKNLEACITLSGQAAVLLQETLEHFEIGMLEEKIKMMHEIEQKADIKKHKMMKAISQAFITPIEREDLVALSSYLDDITDAVEDVLLQIYMSNVSVIRPEVFQMAGLITEGITALGEVIKELKNFKHSRTIGDAIIRVNDLEEKGDMLYTGNMHELHKEGDLRTIIIWRSIYEHMENCLDCCEHAADTIETVILKNS